MSRHTTSEPGGSSTNTSRNKFHSIWEYLESKSKDLAGTLIHSLGYKPRSMPPEAEVFLSICSIFPGDHRIPMEDLVGHMMGLGLFKDVHDMFAARSRVHDIISVINRKKHGRKAIVAKIGFSHENDGHYYQYAKVLDGARDLAKSVASSYPFVFHREIVVGKWPESNVYKDRYGLILVLKRVNEHPIHLECPKISLLQLQYREDSQSIPINFFEGMKELRVLSLDVPSLPRSLGALRNLRTLRLKVSKFEDMSWIGGLVNLNFLSIFVLSFAELPREIGQLENLKLLDLRRMNITYIPPGILSRLLKLEELYLPLNFRNWGCKAINYDDYNELELEEQGDFDREIDGGERINASLIEIGSLSLNALQICLPKASILPKTSPIFKNIREFKILMPNSVLYQPFGKSSVNVLQLTGEVCDIKESGICDLLSRAEDLNLARIRNLENVIYQLVDEGFPNLKKMIVSECDELEYIVDRTEKQILSGGDCLFRKLECLHLSMLSNLKEICYGRWENLQWFSNLSRISIRFCPKLKYVFPLSVVTGLTLTEIEILYCNEMGGIFYEDEDNIPLTLCSIEKLDLYSLPRLISLLVCKDNMIDEVHNGINESLTTNEIVSNDTEGLVSTFAEKISCSSPTSTSRLIVQKGVTQQHISSNQVSAIGNTDAVSRLEMYSVFPSRFAAKWFQNLKSLKIAFCDLVLVVFLFEENGAASKAFNSLEVLELHGLRNLAHIWYRIPPKITAFKNLQQLVLSECCCSYLFSYQVAKLLVQLQKICISRCEKMEEIIIVNDDEDERKGTVLPQLKHLELQQTPNLRTLFGGTYGFELPSLESLKLKQCNKLKSFSCGLMRMPLLEGIEVNGSFQLFRKDLNVIIKGVTIPHRFTLADLKIATKDFSSDNFLGEGGFGKVYKGWIDRKTFAPSETSVGMPVAIKRLNPKSKQGLWEWKSEIDILGTKSHPNLVRLLGHCTEDNVEFLLVYEYIPRGGLSGHLFTRNLGVEPLSWDKRIKIATGAAQVLKFLHASGIVHRDVKAANILLDNDYNTKIADFGLAIWGPLDGDSDVQTMKYNTKISDLGLARLMPVDGKSEVTTIIKGTFGYLDPAYATSGRVSMKSDVYSFGVVLVELMTGLKAYDRKRLQERLNLVTWLKPILSEKRELKNIMDSTMEGQYSPEAMSSIANLALECVNDDRKMRPTMGEVLEKLHGIDAIKQKGKH